MSRIASAVHPVIEPDLPAAVELVTELMAVPGTSGHELAVAETIRKHLLEAGARPSQIEFDDANSRSPLGGEVGNLLLKLPGTRRGRRRLLMAHLDTVPLCVGSKPVRRGRMIRSADPNTGLGADDRAGCAVVLTAALNILRRKLPHPPVTFFWPVQEEVGLFGSHYANLKLLGKPQLAFNWDGGAANKLTIGATGAYRLVIDVMGLASHAGAAPEKGVSAITIAGLAIADLHHGGWLGEIDKPNGRGTSNVGVIQGGAATNVVTNHVQVRAEARSHDPKFRREIVRAFEQAFRSAAAGVANGEGRVGRAKIASRLDYESFRLADDEPCLLAAESAVEAAGMTPLRAISNGGVDANWLSARGIPTVTMGCGQLHVHTVKEQLDLNQYEHACRIALKLATATETD